MQNGLKKKLNPKSEPDAQVTANQLASLLNSDVWPKCFIATHANLLSALPEKFKSLHSLNTSLKFFKHPDKKVLRSGAGPFFWNRPNYWHPISFPYMHLNIFTMLVTDYAYLWLADNVVCLPRLHQSMNKEGNRTFWWDDACVFRSIIACLTSQQWRPGRRIFSRHALLATENLLQLQGDCLTLIRFSTAQLLVINVLLHSLSS